MSARRTISAKEGAAAIAMLDAEKRVAAEPDTERTSMRKCIGSAKFGIEAHEAPIGDFPIQPSQKDGLGRMCRPHWTEYTRALRKAKAQGGTEPTVQSQAAAKVAMKRAARVAAARPAKNPEPIRTRPARGRKTEGERIVEAVDAAIAREAANVEEASIA